MMYNVSLNNNVNATLCADSLHEAQLQALCAYGMDAIDCGISGENGDFMMTKCVKAWQYDLDNYFHGFTMEDVFHHVLLGAYAWVNFPTEKGTEWDYSTGEKYESLSYCRASGGDGVLWPHRRAGLALSNSASRCAGYYHHFVPKTAS